MLCMKNEDRPMINLSGCVIKDPQSRILMHQVDSSCWDLPSGEVAENETEEMAALRIFSDNFGLGVILRRKIGETAFMNETVSYKCSIYEAVIDKGSPDPKDYQIIEENDFNMSNNLRELKRQIDAGSIIV